MPGPPRSWFGNGMNRDEALQGLVDKGVLTSDQADAVRDALREEAPGAPKWLAEAAGYVGGVLMLGGAGILMATQWDAMTRTARAASVGGITLVLLIAAALLALGRSAVRRRIAGVLVAIGSGTAALTAGVIAEHGEGTAAGLTGLAVATIGYAFLRAIPPLLAMGANTIVACAALPGDAWNGTELSLTLTFLAAGLIWFGLAFSGVLTPVPVAFGIAGTIAIAGGQLGLTVNDAPWWGYASTFAVALLCFAVYGSRRTPVLLVAGVVAIALAAPEAVWSWTDGAAGGAVILLVAGAALIGASALGLRLARLSKTSAA
jgi:hypothetical protein